MSIPADIRDRIAEYERIISLFEATNVELEERYAHASERMRELCARHLEVNRRTAAIMREGLDFARKELAQSWHESGTATAVVRRLP